MVIERVRNFSIGARLIDSRSWAEKKRRREGATQRKSEREKKKKKERERNEEWEKKKAKERDPERNIF